MINLVFPPHPALREYVENVHLVEIDFTLQKDLSSIYHFVPTHTRFLCFYLQDKVSVKKKAGFQTKPQSVIIGPQLEPVTLDLGKKHLTMIVELKPCSMYRLLNIPMREIVDHDFDAQLVLGREVDEVVDRLLHAADHVERNAILQRYLLYKVDHLQPAFLFDQAMMQLVNSGGNLSLDYIASQSCLSVRQFERLALTRIGLPPKLYARMIRFSRAYKMKQLFPEMYWHEIAHRCGYFDQNHFIRDFKSFAGFTPGMISKEELRSSVRFHSLSD